MERILLPFEKTLPSTDIRYLVLTGDMVADPAGELERLLADPDLQQEQQNMYETLSRNEHLRLVDFIEKKYESYLADRDITPTPARLGMMASCCRRENLDPRHVCEEFADFIDHIRQCAEMTSDECDIPVVFSDEAIDRLLEVEPLNLDTLNDKCEAVLNSFEYGLRLLSQKTDISKVVVSAEGIDTPEKFINDLVSENFLG
jgi:hypothetical protein